MIFDLSSSTFGATSLLFLCVFLKFHPRTQQTKNRGAWWSIFDLGSLIVALNPFSIPDYRNPAYRQIIVDLWSLLPSNLRKWRSTWWRWGRWADGRNWTWARKPVKGGGVGEGRSLKGGGAYQLPGCQLLHMRQLHHSMVEIHLLQLKKVSLWLQTTVCISYRSKYSNPLPYPPWCCWPRATWRSANPGASARPKIKWLGDQGSIKEWLEDQGSHGWKINDQSPRGVACRYGMTTVTVLVTCLLIEEYFLLFVVLLLFLLCLLL